MRRLVFQPEADADLADIWNFSAGRWSVAQADAYTTRLIEALGALPERSPKAKPYSDIYPGLWRFRYGAHLVFFFGDSETMTVVRILHERMDHATQLRDLIDDDEPPAES